MRMRGTPLLLILALGSVLWVVPALSGPNPDVKLILHLVPTENRRGHSCYTDIPGGPTEVLTKGDLYPQHYFAYVMITDFSSKYGVAGVQFGISYDDSVKSGVDITSWQTCTLYEWPLDEWPASETGNLLTWNQAEDCQEKFPLPVGYFYLTAYSPDRMKLIPRSVDGLARVAVCGVSTVNAEDMVDNVKAENLGWLDFGGEDGYNPWDPEQNLENLQKRFKPIGGKNE